MNADVHTHKQFGFVAEAKNNDGIKVSRGIDILKRAVISREYYYNLMTSLKLLTMW